MKTYTAGVDIGSTTVKLVLLDERGTMVFGKYRRHHAHTQQTLAQLLQEVKLKLKKLYMRAKEEKYGKELG